MTSLNTRDGFKLNDDYDSDGLLKTDDVVWNLDTIKLNRPELDNSIRQVSMITDKIEDFCADSNLSEKSEHRTQSILSKNLAEFGLVEKEFFVITKSKSDFVRQKVLNIIKEQNTRTTDQLPKLNSYNSNASSNLLKHSSQNLSVYASKKNFDKTEKTTQELLNSNEKLELKSTPSQLHSSSKIENEKINQNSTTPQVTPNKKKVLKEPKALPNPLSVLRKSSNPPRKDDNSMDPIRSDVSQYDLKCLLNKELLNYQLGMKDDNKNTHKSSINVHSRTSQMLTSSQTIANKRNMFKKKDRVTSIFTKHQKSTSQSKRVTIGGTTNAIASVSPEMLEILMWPEMVVKSRMWNELNVNLIPQEVKNLVNISVLDKGYNIEFHESQKCIKIVKVERDIIRNKDEDNRTLWSETTTVDNSIDEEDFEIKLDNVDEYKRYYLDCLCNVEHSNYFAYDEENDIYYVASVEDVPKYKNSLIRVLLRSSEGSCRRLLVESSTSFIENVRTKQLFKQIANVENLKFTKVKSVTLKNELTRVEENDAELGSRYKFGVIYVKSNQNEDEIFSNVNTSEDFEEFLEFLGERIKLAGWEKYRGGLNVNGSTGQNSVYTQIEGIEIMFHVCTLLPYTSSDPQQLERKRHIGNDIIIFVFLEQDCEPYLATKITSQFVHVHFVFQKIANQSKTKYLFTVISKSGVNRHVPFLRNYSLDKNSTQRKFVLIKAVNAERATLLSPAFKSRILKSKKNFLKSLYEKHVKKKK